MADDLLIVTPRAFGVFSMLLQATFAYLAVLTASLEEALRRDASGRPGLSVCVGKALK